MSDPTNSPQGDGNLDCLASVSPGISAVSVRPYQFPARGRKLEGFFRFPGGFYPVRPYQFPARGRKPCSLEDDLVSLEDFRQTLPIPRKGTETIWNNSSSEIIKIIFIVRPYQFPARGRKLCIRNILFHFYRLFTVRPYQFPARGRKLD